MEEILLDNGDQVPNGAGGFRRAEGRQALLQRVLFKLSARRGALPFLPRLGSELYRLGREKASARQALCLQYARQALEEEDVEVTGAAYTEEDGQAYVRVSLTWRGEALEAAVQLGGTAVGSENH